MHCLCYGVALYFHLSITGVTWHRRGNLFEVLPQDALNRTYGDFHNCLKNFPNHYINTLLVPNGGEIPVDVERLAAQGILNVIYVDSIVDPKVGVTYEAKSLIQALANLISANTFQ